MRLTEIKLEFVTAGAGGSFSVVETLGEAMGIMFLCPRCFLAKGGPVGTHRVVCWSRSRGVPDDVHPLPGRWRIEGAGLDDLTLNAEPPETRRSVQLTGGCNAHFTIDNGTITFC